MADFSIRSDSVDVEQIMKQIRDRISEKRGVDYTEEQVRELANVRLEKFLDPKNLRSDLLEQFRRTRPPVPELSEQPVEPPYVFDDTTLFASHRGSMRFMRKLLNPILKLFFNPNTLNQVLHAQAQFNVDMLKRDEQRRIESERTRADWNVLYYEVLHNLVLETTRNGIELKNLKMRLEALASRLDFSERRVRALEGVVQYRPEAVRHHRGSRAEPGEGERPRHGSGESAGDADEGGGAPGAEGGAASMLTPSESRRRRRRRRGRRGPGTGGDMPMNGEDASATAAGETEAPESAADVTEPNSTPDPDSQ